MTVDTDITVFVMIEAEVVISLLIGARDDYRVFFIFEEVVDGSTINVEFQRIVSFPFLVYMTIF